MRLLIRGGRPLQGTIRVPGDKSISHRALLLGSIAEGVSRVDGFLPAEDCLATLRVLRALGVTIHEHSDTSLSVEGVGLHGLREPEDVLDCGGSGTTMRLLCGILAGQPFTSVLTGNSALRRRPMSRVAAPLRAMGATVLGRASGNLPPLCIVGGSLRAVEHTLPIASAQVKSGLLLAGLYADGVTTVREPSPSRDHTERMLRSMGIAVGSEGGRVSVTLGAPAAIHTTVPGDLSSAAFLLVAATLVEGSRLTIQDVGVNRTRTALMDVLQAAGAFLDATKPGERNHEPVADVTARTAALVGMEVSGALVPRMID
jgi:3-phosphoshikimate 1-carboxyvinyltransferase